MDNPKKIRAQKDGKVPMELIPWRPLAAVARVLAGGAFKYGVRNWLIDKILTSTYIGAINRHVNLEWAQGINEDADDGEHPLAHVIADCLLVMEAEMHGTLIDDRGHAESKDASGKVTKTVNLLTSINDALVEADVNAQRRVSTARHHHGVDVDMPEGLVELGKAAHEQMENHLAQTNMADLRKPVPYRTVPASEPPNEIMPVQDTRYIVQASDAEPLPLHIVQWREKMSPLTVAIHSEGPFIDKSDAVDHARMNPNKHKGYASVHKVLAP